MTTPNPELMLAAARLARSDSEWRIENLLLRGPIVCTGLGMFEFNPLANDDNCDVLEAALTKPENGGWQFHVLTTKDLRISLYEGANSNFRFVENSVPILLLKCASAQTNIPLEAP